MKYCIYIWHTGKRSKVCWSKSSWRFWKVNHRLCPPFGWHGLIASRCFQLVLQKEHGCSTACPYWHDWSHTCFLSIWSRARMGNDYDLSDMIRDVRSSANGTQEMPFAMSYVVLLFPLWIMFSFVSEYNVSWALRAPTHACMVWPATSSSLVWEWASETPNHRQNALSPRS